MASKSMNGTLGDCLDNGYGIRATCTACWHGADLDIEALARKLGREHGALHNDLVPLLRCTKCPENRVSLTTIVPGVPKIYSSQGQG